MALKSFLMAFNRTLERTVTKLPTVRYSYTDVSSNISQDNCFNHACWISFLYKLQTLYLFFFFSSFIFRCRWRNPFYRWHKHCLHLKSTRNIFCKHRLTGFIDLVTILQTLKDTWIPVYDVTYYFKERLNDNDLTSRKINIRAFGYF